MIVRFDSKALAQSLATPSTPSQHQGGISEVESILGEARRHVGGGHGGDVDKSLREEVEREETRKEGGPELDEGALGRERERKKSVA